MDEKDALNGISEQVIGAAIDVHRIIGPGCWSLPTRRVSSSNSETAASKLSSRSHSRWCTRMSSSTAGMYRLDLVIEGRVIVEIKAVERLTTVHEAQLLSYLRLCGCKLGLLINFHVSMLKNGVRRIVNEFPDSAFSANSAV